MSIEITRGFKFQIEVKNNSCKLILKSDSQKLNITTITSKDGKFYLTSSADDTKKYRAGDYKYQILDADGIVEQGNAVVKQNFALTDQNESVKTKSQVILEAIEAQISGIATNAQSSIHVGDKSISYMTFDELMKARQFFRKKVSEQKKQFINGNEGRIKYKWSL